MALTECLILPRECFELTAPAHVHAARCTAIAGDNLAESKMGVSPPDDEQRSM